MERSCSQTCELFPLVFIINPSTVCLSTLLYSPQFRFVLLGPGMVSCGFPGSAFYPLGNYFHLSPLNTDGPGSIPVFPVSRQYVIHCVTSQHRYPELACFCASTAARGPSPCWGSPNSSLRFFVFTISSVWKEGGSTSIHTTDSNFTQVHIKTSSHPSRVRIQGSSSYNSPYHPWYSHSTTEPITDLSGLLPRCFGPS